MSWWGEFQLVRGASHRFQIGPLSLWALRLEHEWQLAHTWSDDAFDERFEIQRDGVEFPDELERRRYLLDEGSGLLELTPRVADRPVVTRPEQPLIIPAGASARLFVASAVFIEISVGGRLLTELPSWRMPSTWFGENTLEGALCYATRSRAKLEPSARGPRVTTSIDLRNVHAAPLRVERIGLPLPQMGVFADAEGRLWTEATRIAYDPAVVAPAEIASAPPKLAGKTQLLSKPRQDRQQNVLARALTAAFKGVWG